MPPATNDRRAYKLDINDMERRTVDFRLTLDREKRRFHMAQMIDKYEKLLRDRLLEIRMEQTGRGATQEPTQGDNNATSQNQNQQQGAEQQVNDSTTNPDNEIKLTCVDKEGSARLRNFLTYTIAMCRRVDQQELIQDVLRGALMDTRRKRFKSHQENPSIAPEPFCLFCAADLKTVTLASECLNDQHRSQTQIVPAAITSIPNTSLPRVEVVQETPPQSAAPTPEVGEQSHIYTPSVATRDTSSSAPAGPTPSPGPDTSVKRKIVNSKPSNASAKSSVNQVVLPSDDDEGSSDDNNPASLRSVMDWANRSKSPFKKLTVGQGSSEGSDRNGEADETTDERRCSTPLGDNPTLPNLVIDDMNQQTCSSPIPRLSSKSIRAGKSINTTFTAPTEVKPILQQQEPRRAEISTRSMDTSASRLDETSQQQQHVKGGGAIKKKFKPRRRNKNN